MAGLDPAIQKNAGISVRHWMAGSKPGHDEE
jgi:hypothetical protein